ncbi:MAG: TraR/DksA C4-type zinc finger protein [Candidatus Curtissbacteria bacterium]|nr:TraR/DksA C4-type zinc finger protein [Candidatus Curtissbacteria bacterium]
MIIDIKKFGTLIEESREAILSKMRRLRREDPFSTEDRALIVEPGTDAAQLFSHEKTVVLEGQLKRDLGEIEKALEKIKKGTYGICENCKKPIDAARLLAKPAAIYCMKCERELEKDANSKKEGSKFKKR